MARLRAMVPAGNAVARLDPGERKRALVVTGTDGQESLKRLVLLGRHRSSDHGAVTRPRGWFAAATQAGGQTGRLGEPPGWRPAALAQSVRATHS